MMKYSALLAAAACFSAAFAADSNGSGTFDNSDNAKKILSQAVTLSGSYTLKAKSTGATLSYMHNTQPNIFPSLNTVEELLNSITDGNAVAGQAFTLTPNSNGDGSVSICYSDASKCLSSQWNFQYGFDGFAVAYETSLSSPKQYFALVPASSGGSDKKRATKHNDKRMSKHGKRSSKKQDDESSDGGDFFIICVDHLEDMETRAVSNTKTTAFADALAAQIDLWDESADDQVWTLTKASSSSDDN